MIKLIAKRDRRAMIMVIESAVTEDLVLQRCTNKKPAE